MKILMLTSSFPRFIGDHQGNFVFHLARTQVERGNTVLVVCPHIPKTLFHETMEGVEIFRFPYFFPYRLQRLSSDTGMFSALRHSLLAWFQLPWYFFCQWHMAYRIIRKQNPGIIHSHWIIPQGLIGALCHRLFDIPHIATIHGTDLNLAKNSRFLQALCRLIVRNSAVVTINSSYMKKQLEEIVPEALKKNHTIPMGVDLSRFAAGIDPGYVRKNHETKIILNIGRLIDWKGTVYLIKAMPEIVSGIPGVRLIIIGRGPQEEVLRQKVRDLHLENHVEFPGTVSDDALIQYYQSADVFVLPSVNLSGKTEGLGVVLLEAMASRCPVIGSDAGGIPDIIRDGENGFLFPGGDEKMLAKRIIELLSDDTLADRFRKAGYETVRMQFSWDGIAQRFSEVYGAVQNGPAEAGK